MKTSIENKNDKGQLHGYQALFYGSTPARRGTYKANKAIGYYEYHGLGQIEYYIK
jgi:hypothetical protein